MADKTDVSKDDAATPAQEQQPSRSPAYAVMQYDDKVVTSIGFRRAEKDGQQVHSVSFYMAGKRVGFQHELDHQQLVEAVGSRNAKSIIEHAEPKGSLKGESLANEQGLSPKGAVKARAAAEAAREGGADAADREDGYLVRTYQDKGKHDEKHESLDAAMRAFVRADPADIPLLVRGDKVALEYDPEDRQPVARDKTILETYHRVEDELSASGELTRLMKERTQAFIQEVEGRQAATGRSPKEPLVQYDGPEKNVVEPVFDKELEAMDGKEVAARAAQFRIAREQLERTQRERDDLGQRAESKRIGVENLGEKARDQDAANDLAEKTGAPGDRHDQLLTEREKNRQIELMEQVHNQFRVSGPRFHFKDQPAKVAFKDQGDRMVSGSNDDRVAKAMATMAEAKGWKTIKVSGHPEFVREVWMEASLRGLEVRGYKPTEQDKEQMEARRDRAMRNTVEHEPQREREAARTDAGTRRTQAHQEGDREVGKGDAQEAREKAAASPLQAFSGRLLEHGAAHYNHDPKEELSYYVKLATEKGERTVWGVDLARALDAGKAKTGDEVTLEFKGKQPVTVQAPKRDGEGRVIGVQEIATNRNSWEVQKSDRHKVAEAVATALIDANVQHPGQRDALKAAIGARLAERDQAGKVPAVEVYDKSAPSRTRERAGPVVERNAERTRSR